MTNEENNKSQNILALIFYIFIGGLIAYVCYTNYMDRYRVYPKEKYIVLSSGSTYQIDLQAKNDNYYDSNNYIFTSSDENIASVDEYGTIKATGSGNAEISIRYKNSLISEKISINVSNLEVRKISAVDRITIKENESKKIEAIINDDVKSIADLNYYVSNNEIIKVDNYGNVTGLKAGSAEVIIEASNGVSTSVTVIVENNGELVVIEKEVIKEETKQEEKKEETPKKEIVIDPSTATINVGNSINLKVKIDAENTSDLTVTFSSSDTGVATVDNEGKVTGIKKGKVTITALLSNGKKAKSTVIVKEKDNDSKTDETKIKLEKDYLEIEEGNRSYLKTKPSNLKGLKWTSSDSSIVQVSDDGEVIGLKEGTAVITVTYKTSKATAKVVVKAVKQTVEPAPEVVQSIEITNITLNYTSTSILVGKKESLLAIIEPSNATDKTLKWTSSDSNIASVDNSGSVTAKKVGTATITVETTNGKKATCIVNVVNQNVDVTKISLNKTSISIYVGDTETLKTTIEPSNATNKTLTWSSNDKKIATVDKNGVVTGIKAGKPTITVETTNGKKATCTVNVANKEKEVTKVSLNKTSITLNIGSKETLKATIEPSDATDKTITWSTSDKNIATVSDGVVTGIKEGTATITVKTSNGKTATCTVKVESVTVAVKSITLNKSETKLIAGKSETITATINPSNATNKTITWSSNNTDVAKVDQSGKITAVKAGKATITAAIGDKKATITVYVYTDNKNSVDVFFLNTQNAPSMTKETYTSNLSVVLKSKEGKYVVFDTGNHDSEILKIIYRKLKAEQNPSDGKVTVDYLILSHLDGDHIGNAVDLINHDNFKVKNVVVKYEETYISASASKSNAYKNIINAAISEKATIWTSSNMTNSKMTSFMGKSVTFSKLSEGKKIKLSDSVSMYFFNTDDVYKDYKGSDCVDGDTVKYVSVYKPETYDYFKTTDGKYVYLDNTDNKYPNLTYKTTSKFEIVQGDKYFNSRFYAYKSGIKNTCRSNGNSFAVMFSTKVENSPYKYIYMPGDLENNGFDIIPSKMEGYSDPIYGSGGSYIYTDLYFNTEKMKFGKTGHNLKVPSETKTAKTIANSDAFKGKLENIVIYQESHHGFNNAKDAIDILGINRKGVYSIRSNINGFTKSSGLLHNVTTHYSLSNIPNSYKLRTGVSNKNGVHCSIAYDATVLCEYY